MNGVGPLPAWRQHDAPDRQGMTENLYVQGHLAYWDELRRRNPGLSIDSCASGGRRNDLETLRRSVPLWRSDYAYEPSPMQGFSYGMAFWIPFFGTGVNSVDAYVFRSQMTPAVGIGLDLRATPGSYEQFGRLLNQWREVAPYYYGDFYPLTPYTTEDTEWMAWQFHHEAQGGGMVQVFRRPKCPYEQARFRLQGLKPEATYILRSIDTGIVNRFNGRELLNRGLLVSTATAPDSLLYSYTEVR
jgi:alpha-galactosidase